MTDKIDAEDPDLLDSAALDAVADEASRRQRDERQEEASAHGRIKGLGLGLKPLKARLSLLIERVLPVLFAAAAPAFLIAILGLIGVWRAAPAAVHWSAIALALLATAAIGRWIVSRGDGPLWPSRREALQRLERDGGVRHDAVQLFADAPFAGEENALWRAHQERMRDEARKARARAPQPDFDSYDPLGLRFAVPALIAMGLTFAGDDWAARLSEAFAPTDPQLRQAGLIDMWIEPPAYTGRPPAYLLGPNDQISGRRDPIDAPAGSQLIIQAQGGGRVASGVKVHLSTERENAAIKLTSRGETARGETRLAESGVITLRAGGLTGRWTINTTPDAPPMAQLLADPETTENGSVRLDAYVADDYGVVESALEIRFDLSAERHPDAPAPDPALAEEVRRLPLDAMRGQPGPRRAELDLLSDPWAGLDVLARIIVTDAAGQSGESEEFTLSIPSRTFRSPLARAVVEQRQTLAIAPSQWRRARLAFNGLTIGPDRFFDQASDFLLMRTALWRVVGDGDGPKDVDETIDALWPLALQLEDKEVADARALLEEAQAALREAIESGASDAEIARLTEELRQAMAAYLQALANSPAAESMAAQPSGGETMEMSDLNDLLDSVNQLAQSGARGAAQQALDQLESILNNLQLTGQSQGQGQGGQGQSGQAAGGGGQGGAGEAADLIGRQRGLADKTYDRRRELGGAPAENGGRFGDPFGAGAFSSPMNGGTGSPFGSSLGELGLGELGLGAGAPDAAGDGQTFAPQEDLSGEQSDLASDLRELLQKLPRGDGAAPGAAEALAGALDEMREAENALSRGGLDAAQSAMDRAIAQLREGASALAESEAEAGGRGQGQTGGVVTDPFGRSVGEALGGGRSVEVPGAGDPERARELLEELWRRLSTGERTEEEIEYLERLLERF
ncbi:MAG: TIGR02302 family protein [Pseudomonadota bacterium]